MISENRPISTIMQKKTLSRLCRFDVQMSDGCPKSNTRTRRPVLLDYLRFRPTPPCISVTSPSNEFSGGIPVNWTTNGSVSSAL